MPVTSTQRQHATPHRRARRRRPRRAAACGTTCARPSRGRWSAREETAPAGRDRAARRRPRAARGRPGHRQDAARPGRRPRARPRARRASRARPTCCPSDVTGRQPVRARRASASSRAPCSPTSCSSTRSTGRRRARSRRCWRRCRSARSRSRGSTRRLPDPFVVLATQNPVEFEGTFALPQAQLDRFLLRARLGYPDAAGERRIARRYQDAADPLDAIEPVDRRASACSPSATGSGRCASPTRSRDTWSRSCGRPATHPDIELGASPRATVALYRAAQAAAVLEGREFVTPDDVKARRAGRARPPARRRPRSEPPRRDRRRRARVDPRHGRRPAGSPTDPGTRPMAGRRDPAAIALIVIGSLLGVPIAIVLGLVTLLVEVVHAVWARAGLGGIRYTRTLGARRAAFGDDDPDARSRSGTAAGCRSPGCAPTTRRSTGVERPGARPRRRRRARDRRSCATPGRSGRGSGSCRRFHVGADRRGVFRLGPVDLSVGDPFARRAAAEAARTSTRSSSGRGRSRPRSSSRRTAGATSTGRGRVSPRTRRGSRASGPYAAGDPLRRIHARASARLGRPMTKRFEPSRDREVLIALDVQTADGAGVGGRAWADDEVESLYVVAASLARTLGRAAGRVRADGGRLHGRRDADRRVPVSSAPGPGPAGPRPAGPPVGARVRCPSSGCSRSSPARSVPGRRCWS